MIDAVRLTFAALRERGPAEAGELRVGGVDERTPDIRLGLDQDGRPHLLIETEPTDGLDLGLAAISTQERRLTIDGDLRHHVDIVCEVTELSEVFDHFVAAVLEGANQRPGDEVEVVRETMDRWRSFFTAVAAPPARETLTGVLGELLLLRDIARIDPEDVISVWVGPRGGRHDLRRGSSAVEVKSTRSHTSRVVTIHGDDQLLAPDGGRLHLHLVRLEEVAGLGVSIGDLVDEMVGLGVPRLELLSALADANVPPAAFPAVAGVPFDVRERLTFAVDDHMPRIVPKSFSGGQRPTGILDVAYRIDLDHILDRALSEDAFGSLVDDLSAVGGAR